MVHHRCDAPEQRLLIDFADGETIVSVVGERKIGPAAQHNRSTLERARAADHGPAEVLWGAVGAETKIDGGSPAFRNASSSILYVRRMIATLLGAMLMRLASVERRTVKGIETLDSVLSLAEFYQAMRTGTLSLTTAEGKIAFAMALIETSLEPFPLAEPC